MRTIAWFLAFVVIATASALSQSFAEVEAVRDIIFAKDVDALVEHLPSSAQQAFAELTPAQRSNIGRDILIAESFKARGYKVATPSSSNVIAEFEPPCNRDDCDHVRIAFDKRLTDGYESLLRLSFSGPGFGSDEESLEVLLRYEEGAWRVFELAEIHSRLDLGDVEKFAQVLGVSIKPDETSAISALRTINTACVTYSATYPEIGFPRTLDALGNSDDSAEPTAQHSGLLDRNLATAPYEKHGYRFTYRPVEEDSMITGYAVVAVPAGQWERGQRAFYTDDSGVIRFTTDPRFPAANDPPLQ